MARREGNKKQTIEQLAERITAAILELLVGNEASIAQFIGAWYSGQGYEFKHINVNHGYVWTKDGGATFAIEDSDQFDVLDQVTKKLDGQRILDFSKYDDMVVGLPYNLHFTVRAAN